ncbi:L7Ae/L30e/S12e/Gadd45 family ribosomal protein [Aerococcaceae bacterium WGS1372]
MMTKEKKLNILGLAMRARALVSGDELVEKAVKQQKIHLILCASDASIKTIERYRMISERENIPLNNEFTKYELSHAIGKSRSIIGIENKGMANKFLSYDMESEESYD